MKESCVTKRRKINPKAVALAAVCVILTASPIPSSVKAQSEAAETDFDHLASLRACQAIQESFARLACYDGAAGAIIARQENGEIRVVDQQDIRETRRGLFGFSLPRLGIFGSNDGEAETILKSQITGVRKLGSDKWLVTISEGSVWQISNAPRRFRPEVGDEIELEKAALTSYWLRVDGSLGVKGRRVQ